MSRVSPEVGQVHKEQCVLYMTPALLGKRVQARSTDTHRRTLARTRTAATPSGPLLQAAQRRDQSKYTPPRGRLAKEIHPSYYVGQQALGPHHESNASNTISARRPDCFRKETLSLGIIRCLSPPSPASVVVAACSARVRRLSDPPGHRTKGPCQRCVGRLTSKGKEGRRRRQAWRRVD